MAMAISYSWYDILQFNFFEWMPELCLNSDMLHDPFLLVGEKHVKYQLKEKETLIWCFYPLLAGRKH